MITIIAAGLLLTACGVSDDHQAALDNIHDVPQVTEDNITAIADTACGMYAHDPAYYLDHDLPAAPDTAAVVIGYEHGIPVKDALHVARVVGINVCFDDAVRHLGDDE